MAVTVKTLTRRIPLSPATDLKERIETLCDLMATGNQGRRLVATFTVETQLILVFQVAPDNQPPA
jgi:hypothetical protein